MCWFTVFMDIWVCLFFSFPRKIRLKSGTVCCLSSYQVEMFKAIKHFLSCCHALLSQMCMWERFPQIVPMWNRSSSFSVFFQLVQARAFPPITGFGCCVRVFFFPSSHSRNLPRAGSGFCRSAPRQLRLPGMHAAEKVPWMGGRKKKRGGVFTSFPFI